jgi:hypothetical protein
VEVTFGMKPAKILERYEHLLVVLAPIRPDIKEDTQVLVEVSNKHKKQIFTSSVKLSFTYLVPSSPNTALLLHYLQKQPHHHDASQNLGGINGNNRGGDSLSNKDNGIANRKRDVSSNKRREAEVKESNGSIKKAERGDKED